MTSNRDDSEGRDGMSFIVDEEHHYLDSTMNDVDISQSSFAKLLEMDMDDNGSSNISAKEDHKFGYMDNNISNGNVEWEEIEDEKLQELVNMSLHLCEEVDDEIVDKVENNLNEASQDEAGDTDQDGSTLIFPPIDSIDEPKHSLAGMAVGGVSGKKYGCPVADKAAVSTVAGDMDRDGSTFVIPSIDLIDEPKHSWADTAVGDVSGKYGRLVTPTRLEFDNDNDDNNFPIDHITQQALKETLRVNSDGVMKIKAKGVTGDVVCANSVSAPPIIIKPSELKKAFAVKDMDGNLMLQVLSEKETKAIYNENFMGCLTSDLKTQLQEQVREKKGTSATTRQTLMKQYGYNGNNDVEGLHLHAIVTDQESEDETVKTFRSVKCLRFYGNHEHRDERSEGLLAKLGKAMMEGYKKFWHCKASRMVESLKKNHRGKCKAQLPGSSAAKPLWDVSHHRYSRLRFKCHYNDAQRPAQCSNIAGWDA